MPPVTSRSAVSTVRRSRRRSARVAAREPGPSPPTTRTRPLWPSRPRGSPAGRRRRARRRVRSGSRPRTRPISTRTTRRPSMRHSASTPRWARPISAVHCGPASARCAPRSTATAASSRSRPTYAAACRRVPTSRRAATARPRSSSDPMPHGPVIAEYLGAGSATEEFIERWRAPGSDRSRVWEERFGEVKYAPLAEQAWNAALKAAELSPDQVDRLIVTGMHARAVRGIAGRLGASKAATAEDLAATVGNTGTAHASLLLTNALETSEAGQVIALVVLADGVTVLLFRTTDAIAAYRPARSVATQVANGGALAYGKFLSWRGQVTLEPPRRPEPDRISASVSGRSEEWKYAFVGSRDHESGELHLPPARVSRVGDAVDSMDAAPMSEIEGHDRALHHRPDRVLAQPADHVRGRRLRRRRPPPGRAHRRRRRRVEDRRPGRDDVPQAVHRRRHSQLLLESASRTAERGRD